MRTLHRLALTLAATLSLFAAPAPACPNCKEAAASALEDGDDPYREARAYNQSLYFMLAVPYTLAGFAITQSGPTHYAARRLVCSAATLLRRLASRRTAGNSTRAATIHPVTPSASTSPRLTSPRWLATISVPNPSTVVSADTAIPWPVVAARVYDRRRPRAR